MTGTQDNGKEYTLPAGTYRVIDGELVPILDNELAKECLKKELIAEGWTPPAEKEPEFRIGDLVEVFSSYHNKWMIGYYAHYNMPHAEYRTDNGISGKRCRHAPSWLKPESGEKPYNVSRVVYQDVIIFQDKESDRYWLEHNDKWYWLPLED